MAKVHPDESSEDYCSRLTSKSGRSVSEVVQSKVDLQKLQKQQCFIARFCSQAGNTAQRILARTTLATVCRLRSKLEAYFDRDKPMMERRAESVPKESNDDAKFRSAAMRVMRVRRNAAVFLTDYQEEFSGRSSSEDNQPVEDNLKIDDLEEDPNQGVEASETTEKKDEEVKDKVDS